MAATRNTTMGKEVKKQAKEYKVIGDRFRNKKEAKEALRKVFDKGFKGVGLMIEGNEFIILFGTYTTEEIVKVNLEEIIKAGFAAAIKE